MGSVSSSTLPNQNTPLVVHQTDSHEKVPPNLGKRDSRVRFQAIGKMSREVHKHRRKTRTYSKIFAQNEEILLARHPELDEILDKFEDVCKELADKKNEEECQYKHMYELIELHINEPFVKFHDPEQRLLMGNNLAKIGFVEEVVKYYINLSENHGGDPFTEELMEDEKHNVFLLLMVLIRTILWNYSDGSHNFGLKIATNTILFQYLVYDLKEIYDDIEDIQPEEGDKHFPFNSTLGIIHNCARAPVRRNVYKVKVIHEDDRTENMVDCLTPFIETRNTYVKLVALLALSFIVNEEQNKLLSADDTMLDFLLEMITKASKAKDRRHFGFSVEELVDGLANLARNDDNKTKIMNKGAFPMLKNIISKGNIKEQTAVAKAIWELAFAQKNKKEFVADETLMTQIHKLEDSEDENLAKAAQGASFVLKDSERNEGRKTITATSSKAARHVMISYNWSDQKIILRVRDDLLQYGCSVWMDVDNMEGSILEGMATAVENASMVLICYSEKYKDSQNCRTEAEYAYKRKKYIVPLRMQEKYEPDGWLGILLGSKMFYEFTTKYPYQDKFDELLKKEIFPRMDNLKESNTTKVISEKPQTSSSQPPPVKAVKDKQSQLITWSKSDVTKWLTENKLQGFSGLTSLTGEQIIFLYKVFRRSPEFFYRCIEEKLGLKSLEELMRFSNAIEKLSQEHPEILQSLF